MAGTSLDKPGHDERETQEKQINFGPKAAAA
jgi:hypothetical protein